MTEKYACQNCNLIYTLARINLVSGDPKDVLGNYCPNCASDNVETWRSTRVSDNRLKTDVHTHPKHVTPTV